MKIKKKYLYMGNKANLKKKNFFFYNEIKLQLSRNMWEEERGYD